MCLLAVCHGYHFLFTTFIATDSQWEKCISTNLGTLSIRWMAAPADFNSGVGLNDTAVEAQAWPSPRSDEEWLATDDEAGATQLPTILTLSTAVGLSTQCPTDSVKECLLLVTTVTVCDNDEGAADVCNKLLSASDTTVLLLLGDADIIASAGHTVTTSITHKTYTWSHNFQ